MKELFTMLPDPRFHLLYGVTQRFSIGPEPHLVRLNREGFKLVEGVTKKTAVYPRMRLGIHPSPYKGDVFSPIYGHITEINERSVFVERAEPTPEQLELVADMEKNKVDVLALPERGAELGVILKGLGLNTRSLGQDCETLIINGLNPDPGVAWAEPMLLTHLDNLKAGVEALHHLSPAKRILLAVPKQLHLHHNDMEVVHIDAQYPASVNALVVKAVTGQEAPPHVGIVGLHNVWSLGRVVLTGLPLIETVLTLGSEEHTGNYIVKEGSTIGELLEFANIELKEGDTLVRGGPLRGESLDRLDRSVTKGSTGVFVVDSRSVPPMEGHSPCINCGACTLVCPARLSPSLLSRYAEFGLHERNRKESIDRCLECGLCGYVCIARRPVLQYIRLSKHRLAKLDAMAKLAEIQPVTAPAGGKDNGGNA